MHVGSKFGEATLVDKVGTMLVPTPTTNFLKVEVASCMFLPPDEHQLQLAAATQTKVAHGSTSTPTLCKAGVEVDPWATLLATLLATSAAVFFPQS